MKQAIGDLFQKPELTSARKEPGRRWCIRMRRYQELCARRSFPGSPAPP